MDILQMMPSLMIAGYEDVITNYNLRIDNCAINVDTRLVISQMKAKDIAKIQVCDNTGVAKGTIGMNKVLDIYLKMPDAWQGFVEGQGAAGRNLKVLPPPIRYTAVSTLTSLPIYPIVTSGCERGVSVTSHDEPV